MKVLITGASGFIGSHLCRFLLEKNYEVHAITRNTHFHPKHIVIHRHDSLEKDVLKEIITTVSPDIIYHLAAQSLVTSSWQNPTETFHANIDPTIYILETLRTNNIKARLVILGSSSEYAPKQKKITETDKLDPNSPYGLSKLVQDTLGTLYYTAYGLDIVRVRPFFIIGPGKTGDVVSDFSRSIVAIERGKQTSLSVGNLTPYRDFLDIQDFLEGLYLISQKGERGNVYNICSGKAYQIKKILNKLCSFSCVPIPIITDETKYRPIDEPRKIGDNSRLQKLGWSTKIAMDVSLESILTFWRNQNDLSM